MQYSPNCGLNSNDSLQEGQRVGPQICESAALDSNPQFGHFADNSEDMTDVFAALDDTGLAKTLPSSLERFQK
jgi:hypothetical protein